MARPRASTKATTRPRRTGAAAAAREILAWEDDPGAPTDGFTPVLRPVPKLDRKPLPIAIRGRAPRPKHYRVGTSGFRYWAAAEALRRAADLWAGLVPSGTAWYPSNGASLPVRLDDGQELNAYYDRNGLHFFHEAAGGITVYSGESPNVACHELGHAVLDALRPQLFDAASIESAAFHESWADMSALLSSLQLQSFRQIVLTETGGNLFRTSRLSRLAEQLGWAIRQSRPDLVDPDCLRNAVNSFFYRDPATLPPDAPAHLLSSEPHSFSRVFTAGFLQSLAGMYTQSGSGDATLVNVSSDAGRLLVAAVRSAPVVTGYYSQVAAHMIDADAQLFGARYRDSLQAGFVRHGVLSLQSASAVSQAAAPPTRRGMVATLSRRAPVATAVDAQLPQVAVSGRQYGVDDDILLPAAAEPARFSVAGAALDGGSVTPVAHDVAATAFLEDLLRRGRVDLGSARVGKAATRSPLARKTHELKREAAGLVLRRRFFDCGFACG